MEGPPQQKENVLQPENFAPGGPKLAQKMQCSSIYLHRWQD
jgi:hypothetical protein